MKTSIETIEDFISEMRQDVGVIRASEVRVNVERDAQENKQVKVVWFRAGYLREIDDYLELVELLIEAGKDYDEESKPGTKEANKLHEQIFDSLNDTGLKLRRGRIDLNG